MARQKKDPQDAKLKRAAFDLAAIGEDFLALVGVDEAGRGAFAGPVVAAGVLLNKGFYEEVNAAEILGMIKDSKQMTAPQRETVFQHIKKWQAAGLLTYEAEAGDVREIETWNILGATKRAVERLLFRLMPADPLLREQTLILIDGKPMSGICFGHQAVVKGDDKSLVIAMASIIAKVTRDAAMVDLESQYPAYGFSENKGYGTEKHIDAIRQLGPINELHRKLFIQNVLAEASVEKELQQLELF